MPRSARHGGRTATWLSIVFGVVLASAAPLGGQVVTFTQQRPFVIGVVPVVANGAVGGIEVDAAGLVARAERGAIDRFRASKETWSAGSSEAASPEKGPGAAPLLHNTALK